MRILNVADFNWMTGAERRTVRLSLFDIRRKFTLAATRANHLVVEFSDRAVARRASLWRNGTFGDRAADRRFLQTVDEFKPDLIWLHFADHISNAALNQARRLAPGVTIVDINIDPIDTAKNQKRLAARRGAVDALFVTTADPALAAFVTGPSFAAYLPNPVDPAVETGRAFETVAPQFDLLFAAHDGRPRDLGPERLSPAMAVQRLRVAAPMLRLYTPGVAGEAEAGGYAYFQALQAARMGWSLSRRIAPLYASDRMAHFFGWGLAVLMDRRSGFDRFYSVEEAVFYDDLDDLAGQAAALKADDARARAMAQAGWVKTWSLFHSGKVLDYVMAQLFDAGGARDFPWPCDRWSD